MKSYSFDTCYYQTNNLQLLSWFSSHSSRIAWSWSLVLPGATEPKVEHAKIRRTRPTIALITSRSPIICQQTTICSRKLPLGSRWWLSSEIRDNDGWAARRRDGAHDQAHHKGVTDQATVDGAQSVWWWKANNNVVHSSLSVAIGGFIAKGLDDHHILTQHLNLLEKVKITLF